MKKSSRKEIRKDLKKFIKNEVRNDIRKYGLDILCKDTYRNAKNHVQHGTVSVFRHSLHVAETSLRWAKKLPFNFSERELVRGALLHDYFGYDWHGRKSEFPKIFKMHGFTHAKRALENAVRDFDLGHIEKDIIGKHMWPLTLRSMPMKRESWLVTAADKYVSLMETLHIMKGDMKGETR